MSIYAHTLENHPPSDWEPLYGMGGHAEKVVSIMQSFRNPFAEEVLKDAAPLFRILGLYHDMGKASDAFQRYLSQSAEGRRPPKVNHKTQAARFVWEQGGRLIHKILAYAFEGHHAGLPDGEELFSHLCKCVISDEVVQALPAGMENLPAVKPPQISAGVQSEKELAFSLQMAVRMLHSCLVDADWLATESFMDALTYKERISVGYEGIETLSCRVEEAICRLSVGAKGHIAGLRQEIHEACYAAAGNPLGIYRLNVPTGGGKTLSSLSFALAHARTYGLQRVIYVIPFTSIIDQTAEEFRKVLGAGNVLEHHSNIGEEKDTRRNRLAAENWDAPVIVTTNVQFFETLFACKNKRCRKLHNIARSVIIFDEAQNLPTDLLAPCVAAMKSLQRQYGCTLVFCSATQPALGYRKRYFEIGWPPKELHSLIGEEFEARLAREMKRVEVHRLGKLSREALVNHFMDNGKGSALFIVNLTRQAQELFGALKEQGVMGLFHLSARMCPAHRSAVLAEVRERLSAGMPTVLVSTRVVEAGVDISFPVVYRDRCGLDSLAQSAGRCNRHGEASLGHVYAYEAEGVELPASFVDLREGINAFEDVLSGREEEEAFSPEIVERYFQLFYSNRKGRKGQEWDKEGILGMVGEAGSMVEAWDFPAMAEKFRLMPGGQGTLLVPYGEEGEELRGALVAASQSGRMPSRQELRRAQQLSVTVYDGEWEALAPYRESLHQEAGIWMLTDEHCYSPDVGLIRDLAPIEYIM